MRVCVCTMVNSDAAQISGTVASMFVPLPCRQIRDTVHWIFSEQMLVYYINVFRDTFWPNGKLAPHNKIRSDAEHRETKEKAQQKLLDNIPGICSPPLPSLSLSPSLSFSLSLYPLLLSSPLVTLTSFLSFSLSLSLSFSLSHHSSPLSLQTFSS